MGKLKLKLKLIKTGIPRYLACFRSLFLDLFTTDLIGPVIKYFYIIYNITASIILKQNSKLHLAIRSNVKKDIIFRFTSSSRRISIREQAMMWGIMVSLQVID